MRAFGWMLATVLAVAGCLLVALQLVYADRAPPPGPASLSGVQAGAGSAPRMPPPTARSELAAPPSAALPITVAAAPLRSGDPVLTRDVDDCVERKALAAGVDRIEPTLPGRWPALKRAREVRRLRRLELRAACERELGPG